MLAEDRNVLRLMRSGLPRRGRLASYLPELGGQLSYTTKEKYAQENDDLEHAVRHFLTQKSRYSSRLGLMLAAVLISCSTVVWRLWPKEITHGVPVSMSLEGACPQQLAISPEEHSGLLAGIEKIFKSEDFRLGAYESLGGAVRIP